MARPALRWGEQDKFSEAWPLISVVMRDSRDLAGVQLDQQVVPFTEWEREGGKKDGSNVRKLSLGPVHLDSFDCP